MTATFSSNESCSLERSVEIKHELNGIDEIWSLASLKECKHWIEQNQFQNVCLQFPDDLICYSAKITEDLVAVTSANIFILGDTSYGSCCVDEIASAHISADSIIHFGHACLSKVTRLPLFYVFPNYEINLKLLSNEMVKQFKNGNERIMIFYNVGYFYNLDSIKTELKHFENIQFGKLAVDCEPNVLCWSNTDLSLDDVDCIYIGQDDQTLFNLILTLNAKSWYNFDPHSHNTIKPIEPLTTNWMRRRYFYIEKCKDTQTLGIVFGTLAAKGYLDLVKHIQALARNRGVRTYLISVGKVNLAKLANFSEIDCFVLIGCPENNIFTSRDFYKPLLSVFEVEMALNPVWHNQLPSNYCIDFNEFLPNGKLYREYENHPVQEIDVSLVTGKIRRNFVVDNESSSTTQDGTLVERKNHQIMLSDSIGAFHNRSWTGLDPALGIDDPTKIQDGRSGIAMKYSVENE